MPDRSLATASATVAWTEGAAAGAALTAGALAGGGAGAFVTVCRVNSWGMCRSTLVCDSGFESLSLRRRNYIIG